jgi:glycerophosphoryl diester phosphodiesterase
MPSTIREAYARAKAVNRPLVFGHRGAMAHAPQNTMAAFRAALDQGADGIELDVQLSADGQPVVIHDDTVDATTDGTGRVDRLDLSDIRKLDAGSWFAKEFAGTRIPLLDEVFEEFGSVLFVNVELKYSDSVLLGLLRLAPEDLAAGAWRPLVEPVARAVVECIQAHGMSKRVIVSSFNPLALRLMAEWAPDIAAGFIWAPDVPGDTPAMMRGTPYQAYHPEWKTITARLVAEEHGASRLVNAWTANDPGTACRLAEEGVDGIITNDPAAIIAALYRNPR